MRQKPAASSGQAARNSFRAVEGGKPFATGWNALPAFCQGRHRLERRSRCRRGCPCAPGACAIWISLDFAFTAASVAGSVLSTTYFSTGLSLGRIVDGVPALISRL